MKLPGLARTEILSTDQFARNAQAFDELKQAVAKGFVIPFVGAGLSVSDKLPTWTDYVLCLCGDAGLDTAAMAERLRAAGDYEGAINDILVKIGVTRLERDFERDFAVPGTIEGP